ncbi:MAG: YsnF/AvaK domain-containing protein [Ktedonobacteraceae bacterium]
MAVQSSIIAGVFNQESQARRALDALRQAGFQYDQVGIATQGQGNVNLLSDLTDLGVSRDYASYYDQEYKNGRTVVSVRPDGRDQEAHDILHRYEGYDYEHQTGYGQTDLADNQRVTSAQTNVADTQAQAYDRNAADYAQDEFHQPRSLRLREERLNVTKERAQTGEVELHKEVISEQKTINVPVTHEEVIIERHAVTDGRTDTTPIGEGETIRVPVSEEQVNVSKNTVVTGEVALGKRAVQETQQVTDTVKREEARIDQQGNPVIHGSENDNLHTGRTTNEGTL